jgi:hypothetical protein
MALIAMSLSSHTSAFNPVDKPTARPIKEQTYMGQYFAVVFEGGTDDTIKTIFKQSK